MLLAQQSYGEVQLCDYDPGAAPPPSGRRGSGLVQTDSAPKSQDEARALPFVSSRRTTGARGGDCQQTRTVSEPLAKEVDG